MAAHQKRYDDWQAEQAKGGGEAPKAGGLLPPMPKGPAPKRRRRKTPTGPQQKQIDHPWAYLVAWYEEIRNHTPTNFGLQRILFSEIAHWKDLFEVETEPWEIDVLTHLDRVWFSALPKDPKKRQE